MNEMIFNFINYVQAQGWSATGALFSIAGILGTAGFLFHVWFSYKLKPEVGSIFVTAGVLAGLMIMSFGVGVLDWSAKNSENYKVGMCFRQENLSDYRIGVIKEEITRVKADNEKLIKAIAVARQMKTENSEQMTKELGNNSLYLTKLQQELQSPKFIDYVVVSQDAKSHLVYLKTNNSLDLDFSIYRPGAFKVECSADLKEVVEVYQATGKIVASNK